MQKTRPSDIETWLYCLSEIAFGAAACPPFLKPLHLVTLGLAVKQNGFNGFRLPSELETYAARMKLWDSVKMTAPCAVREKPENGRFLPVQRFDQDEKDVRDTVDKLAKLVIQNAPAESKNALDYCLQEIVNNFFDHANAHDELPCLIAAQSWPKGNMVQIAIADAGIGIRRSLSENFELEWRMKNENACKVASEYGVTSKKNGHSGYGLALAKDLMNQSGGTYALVSGREIFMSTDHNEYESKADYHWNGTLLILEWQIDKVLDAAAVYQSWPTD